MKRTISVGVWCTVLASLVLACATSGLYAAPVAPKEKDPDRFVKEVTQGALRIETPMGQVIECPLKHTDVKAAISGFIARVTVTQTFLNPMDERIEAIYVFPLPHKAAIDSMTMVVGDRRIIGVIKKRAEARQIYEQAIATGATAALLEQERPNIFTQSVGNIQAKQEVKIEITYIDVLEYDQGVYEFHFPMVVGPRYIPGGATSAIPDTPHDLEGKVGALDKNKVAEGPNKPKGDGWSPDTDTVPDASRITPPVLKPGFRNGHDIALFLTLDAGVPVQDIKIANHKFELKADKKVSSKAEIRLAPDDSIPNKDFVVRYAVIGKKPEMAVLGYTDKAGQGYFLLMVQPKEDQRLLKSPPREIVFLVDVSGSMSGQPTAKEIQAMQQMLKLCRQKDTVQVITFASQSQKLFEKPVPVNDANISKALNFTEGLKGGGGTEMLKGVKLAIDEPIDKERIRIVIMLTDGFIGNEAQIIEHVGKNCGDQIRFWCVGIGSSPNRMLLDGVAKQGGGMAKVLGLNDDSQSLAMEVISRIQRAQLSKVKIDWGKLPIRETYPAQIPELWSGRPIVLFGLCDVPADHARSGVSGKITISGKIEGDPASWPLEFAMPPAAGQDTVPALGEGKHEVLAKVWARQKIEDVMQSVYYGTSPAVEETVVAIALKYGLMSQYTSFVAVDAKNLTKEASVSPPRRMLVAVPIPEGTQYEGFFGSEEDGNGFAPVMAWKDGGGGAPAELPLAPMASTPPASTAPAAFSRLRFAHDTRGGARGGRQSGAYAMAGKFFAQTKGLGYSGPSGGWNAGSAVKEQTKALREVDRSRPGAGGGFYDMPVHGGSQPYLRDLLQKQAQELAPKAKEALDQARKLAKDGKTDEAAAMFATAYLVAEMTGQDSSAAQSALEKLRQEQVKAWAKSLPALDKKLGMVLRDMSIEDAVAQIAKAGFEAKILPGSLQDTRRLLHHESRVTFLDLRGATVAQALDWLLLPERLTWRVQDGKVVIATSRLLPGQSTWVYDVGDMSFPLKEEFEKADLQRGDWEKIQKAFTDAADEFMAAVKSKAVKDAWWVGPGQVLLSGDAKAHQNMSRLMRALASSEPGPDAADLHTLYKHVSKRLEARKDIEAKSQAAYERMQIVRAFENSSWRLLRKAWSKELDLEALTELQVAWKSKHLGDLLKQPTPRVFSCVWAIGQAARLIDNKELAELAKQARAATKPLAKQALADLEKKNEPSAYVCALYVAMDAGDSGLGASARELLAGANDSTKAIRPIAMAIVSPSKEATAELAKMLAQPIAPADLVLLSGIASRQADRDTWEAFRAVRKDLLSSQPMNDELALLIQGISEMR